MLAALPLPAYMTGKQATLFAVRGATKNNSGSLVYSANIDMLTLGVFKEMTYQHNWNQAEIHPSNTTMENHVDVTSGFTISLRDLRTDDGYTPLLDTVATGYPYLRILCQNTSVTGAAGYVFCAVGIRQAGGFNQAEGEHNGSITLHACGVPVYWGLAVNNPL